MIRYVKLAALFETRYVQITKLSKGEKGLDSAM